MIGWFGVPACAIYCAATVAGVAGWPVSIFLLAGLTAAIAIAWRGARRRERRYRNPLRGILELLDTAPVRTSILADSSPKV